MNDISRNKKMGEFPKSYPISALREISIKSPLPKVLIMCGLPNSGKSKLAKMIAKSTGATILSSGEYRSKMFPRSNYSQKESEKVFESIRKDATELIESGLSVIFDATNLETKNRKTYIRIAKKYQAEVGCIYVESSFDESKEDNPENVDESILLRMSKNIHVPSYCEGLAKIYCVDKNPDFRMFLIDRGVMTRIQNSEKRKYSKKFFSTNSNSRQVAFASSRHTA